MPTVTPAGSGLYKQQLWSAREKRKEAAAKPDAEKTARQTAAAADVAAASLRAGEETDWLEALYSYLDELEQTHPGVECNLVSLQNDSELRGAAAALGPGKHLLLSPEFLLQMASGREAFAAGKDVLEEALRRLGSAQSGANTGTGVCVSANGEAVQWSARFAGETRRDNPFRSYLNGGGLVRKYRDKDNRYITEIRTPKGTVRFVFRKTYRYYAGEDMARLTGMKKLGNVRAFIAGMHAEIKRVRGDKFLSEEEVRVAVAKMKGVIVRARIKIKNLQEEETLEARGRHSAENADVKRAKALERELRFKRQLRQLREKMQAAKEPFVPPDLLRGKRAYDKETRDAFAAADFAAVVSPVEAVAEAPAAEAAAVTESVDILA